MRKLIALLILVTGSVLPLVTVAQEVSLLGSWSTNINGYRTQNHPGVFAMSMTNGLGVAYECLRPNSNTKNSLVCEWYVMLDNVSCNKKRDRLAFLMGSGNFHFSGFAECFQVINQNNINTSFFKFYDQKGVDTFFANSNNTDAQIAFHEVGPGIQVNRIKLTDVKGVRQVIQNIALGH